jgi:poly-gamma-glutamate synthesis protein (capsule biosynthesis protein)
VRRSIAVVFVVLVVPLVIAACGEGDVGTGPDVTPSPTVSPSPTSVEPPTPSDTATATPIPTPTPSLRVTLAAGGDVMLGRTIGEGIEEFGPLYPFEGVVEALRGADVAFVNLESPLAEGGAPADKDFVFLGPPEGAEALAQSGIDIVALANNHAIDYGLEGLAATRVALEAAGVGYVGAGDDEPSARAPVIVERNGLRLAFLAYANTPRDSISGFDLGSAVAMGDKPGLAWLTPEVVAEDVTSASSKADLVIVSMHTGFEYQEGPNELQVSAARAAIDAGADLVLGHHPHVLQGIERYEGGLIAYSLGNFVFDFDYLDYAVAGLPSSLSAVLTVELGESGVIGCAVTPVVIGTEDGRPQAVEGEEARAVLERLERLSDGSCGLREG